MTVINHLSYYKNHLHQLYFEKSESQMMDVGIGRRMDGWTSEQKENMEGKDVVGRKWYTVMKVDLKEPSWGEEGLYCKVRKKEVMTEPRRKKDGKVERKTRSSVRPEPPSLPSLLKSLSVSPIASSNERAICKAPSTSPSSKRNFKFATFAIHSLTVMRVPTSKSASRTSAVARWIATPCSAKYL